MRVYYGVMLSVHVTTLPSLTWLMLMNLTRSVRLCAYGVN
jgi:hypothetical protein